MTVPEAAMRGGPYSFEWLEPEVKAWLADASDEELKVAWAAAVERYQANWLAENPLASLEEIRRTRRNLRSLLKRRAWRAREYASYLKRSHAMDRAAAEQVSA